ncbi:aldo/keto reductase [Ralstonia sp. CHL-2022]|uniref:Aldo/keto reductase n=1 Tax=Ralstonia mojiangensis TaxID=2953895 RepID=A0ABT2LFD2_9RALS|nr:aldo/keto reductase [Ralstonia mojiangensis]MCT7299255.1 aldo/keto reductase [Ralstonia mojiangensis]MCT7314015.1 aldo/keto reductase [Ralstonia mojiangensis]
MQQTLKTQGVSIPRLGLGTFRVANNVCQPVVESALALGYRHIDTAAMYANEDAVGAAIAASGLPREEVFVTTKAWHDQLAPRAVPLALEQSLAKLKLDYVDLYLVHWPAPDMDMAATMEAMMALRESGRVRAIGVCNFNLPMLKTAIDTIGTPLACVQVEYHPFLDQSALLRYLRGKGIPLTAYAPLAQGRAAEDATLQAIGRKHGASASQVAIAWLLEQPDVIAIPKAQRRESQQANLDALRLRLDDADRVAIAALPKTLRYVQPAFAPDWDAVPA